MANTTFASDLVVQQWQKKFFVEYVRDSRFNRYMGSDENKIIQLVMDLQAKRGDRVTVQLVTRLAGTGVTGDNTLRGNEEALGNYGDTIVIDQLRNAVARGDFEQQKGNIDLLNAARMMLKMWIMENLRDEIIARMQSPNLDGTTTYAASTEPQKDAYLQANVDRVLFGAAKSNTAGGAGTEDHSASLANVDSTTDVLSPDLVSLARRMARDASPNIRPVRVTEDEEWFVLFCNKWAFRDFKQSADYKANLQNGAPRSLMENPLFRDGDLVHDGVILREIVEIPVIAGVGAASIDVAPNFLCGAQAIGIAWATTTQAIADTDDYGNIQGVGVREVRGQQKLFFNDKQHGMLTLYTSGVADT